MANKEVASTLTKDKEIYETSNKECEIDSRDVTYQLSRKRQRQARLRAQAKGFDCGKDNFEQVLLY